MMGAHDGIGERHSLFLLSRRRPRQVLASRTAGYAGPIASEGRPTAAPTAELPRSWRQARHPGL